MATSNILLSSTVNLNNTNVASWIWCKYWFTIIWPSFRWTGLSIPCYKGYHKHKDVGLGMGQKPSFLNSGRTVKSSNAQGRCWLVRCNNVTICHVTWSFFLLAEINLCGTTTSQRGMGRPVLMSLKLPNSLPNKE